MVERNDFMVLKELTNEEFYTFTINYPLKSLYQTNSYAFVMHEQNYDSVFLGLIDDNNRCVAASLILIEKKNNFKYAYAPRGFLIDYTNFELLKIYTQEIKKYLNKLDVVAIKIAPLIIRNKNDINHQQIEYNPNFDCEMQNLKQLDYFHMGFNNYFEALKPRYEAIVDLDKNYQVLFSNFYKETKTKIRSAVNKGVLIYRGREENLGYLYAHTKKKYPRDLKFFNDCFYFFGKSHSIDFYYAKLDTQTYIKYAQTNYNEAEKQSIDINNKILAKNNNNISLINKKMSIDKRMERCKRDLILATNLLSKYPQGLVLASILVVKNAKEIYVLMDGMDPKYKKFNAKHLLIWKLIEKYSKEGYSTFNLGGCSNPNVQDNKYEGLNNFKLSFNSKIYEYVGDFELIINKAKYFMFQNSMGLKNILKK